MISVTRVDAALDTVSDDDSPASALADLLDDAGDWDWTDGSEHSPSDRFAILESSGAYWLVYRGAEPDEAKRYTSVQDARAELEEKTAI